MWYKNSLKNYLIESAKFTNNPIFFSLALNQMKFKLVPGKIERRKSEKNIGNDYVCRKIDYVVTKRQ